VQAPTRWGLVIHSALCSWITSNRCVVVSGANTGCCGEYGPLNSDGWCLCDMGPRQRMSTFVDGTQRAICIASYLDPRTKELAEVARDTEEALIRFTEHVLDEGRIVQDRLREALRDKQAQ
jgi:hypothetical protein